MKRISWCLILLALTPGIVQAWGYGSSYCRIRYSPYALRYGKSGLVQGRPDYSLYAFDYDSSGLVTYCYGGYSMPCGYLHPAYVQAHVFAPQSRPAPKHAVQPPARGGYSNAASGASSALAAREGTEPQSDGLDVIRRHLQGKGVGDVDVNRILRIDDMLVSADIQVRSRNVLIKYWNPDAIGQLDAKEAHKRNAYEKYRQDWDSRAIQYQAKGGEVYSITASEARTIVALLDCCAGLDARRDEPQAASLYAKN